MASNGKIYITISDERGKGGAGSGSGGNENINIPKGKENHLGSYVVHQGISLLQQTASQYVHYSISNIGNFTGDYLSQKNAQLGLGLVNKAIGYGTTALAGFKLGGILGSVVAGGIKATMDSLSFNLQEKAQYTQNQRTNYQISQLRELSGLNTLTDGSRGSLS